MTDMTVKKIVEQELPFKCEVPVLGLDPSLAAFGVCEIHRNKMTTYVLSPAAKGPERLLMFGEWFNAEFRSNWGAVAFEDYAFSRANQAHQLGELGGVLRTQLYISPVPEVYVVGPGQLKKYATGKGSGPKTGVMLALLKRWGIEVQDDNQADATTLALIAAQKLGYGIDLPKSHMEVFEGKTPIKKFAQRPAPEARKRTRPR